MATSQNPRHNGDNETAQQKVDALELGDRISLPHGQVLTIEKVDRRVGRPDRFAVAEVSHVGRFSHRDYDLERAFLAGAEVLNR
jgi:hypothetical protein